MFFFFKQKTAYEMRISDWSSEVCSSDLLPVGTKKQMHDATKFREFLLDQGFEMSQFSVYARFCNGKDSFDSHLGRIERNLPEKGDVHVLTFTDRQRSEEHTSELQSLMRISYAVFCLKKKKNSKKKNYN